MRRMNVSALPRNYALYYEAVTNPQSEIAAALARLGEAPPQSRLDELAEAQLDRPEAAKVSEAHGEIMSKLSEIIALLKIEQTALEKYGQLLGETSLGLNGRHALSQDFLQRVVSLISTATDTTLDHGRKIASSMSDRSAELAEVQSKLAKYKKLADTDALTQLSNRRSFDREIAAIYEDKRKVMFSSLILADIDMFKPVNDTHGHPVGDRILQIVAGIFGARSCSRVFVARAGGEEFALILRDYTEESATRLAEEIRLAVEQTPFVNVATGKDYGPITISFGLCMASEAEGPDDLYTKADRALYASKSNGRNRVTRYSELATGNFVKNWLLYASD
ncbi:diguanylate cyclase [Chelativorans sp. ZYF759]|nr:diguanylate cyclase [Chelativorans sp. ZYF759]